MDDQIQNRKFNTGKNRPHKKQMSYEQDNSSHGWAKSPLPFGGRALASTLLKFTLPQTESAMGLQLHLAIHVVEHCTLHIIIQSVYMRMHTLHMYM